MIGASFRYPASVMAVIAAGVAIQAGALWWRRRWPLTVLLVVILIELATIQITAAHESSGLTLAFAVYAVSVYDHTRVRMYLAGAAILVILAAVILLLLGDFATSRLLIPAGALALIAWVIGDYVRSRRRFFTELIARHQAARELATEEERLRIARELHDVVTHNVSLMAIQAGAARVSGNSSHEALVSIEETARDTMAELNRLLGVLRKQSDAPLTPQPGLVQVDTLIRSARDAGVEATITETGDPRPLPTALDLSAFRIVQEAITNVLKHANASRVEVTFEYHPDKLVLSISDNGTGATRKVGAWSGHGLIGIRERVELFGGDLSTSSSPLGGFTIRATLPIN